MTPQQEKAKELFLKFMNNVLDYTQTGLDPFKAKQCALIAVDEIIKECEKFFEAISENRKLFWQEVKKEIEKL